MTATYLYKDGNGRTLQSVPGVLAPIALSGGVTTSASHIITVASTAGLYPGMSVQMANVPRGAFIHTIVDDTHVQLWASAWNASTGVWTTSAANAQASSSASGLSGQASGVAWVPVMDFQALGTWRNTFRTPSTGVTYALQTNPPFAVVPTTGISGGGITYTAFDTVRSDEVQTTPLKRHEGAPHGFWVLVSTGGFISIVPADAEHSLCVGSLSS